MEIALFIIIIIVGNIIMNQKKIFLPFLAHDKKKYMAKELIFLNITNSEKVALKKDLISKGMSSTL